MVFTANAGGVTTANSSYPRSELREMDGDKLASWSNRTGTHTLAVRQAVTELPKAKPELVTAQIHDTESDVIEIRLEDNRLIAQYADGKKEFVVDPDYVLGTPYDLRLVAADGRIDVWYNGNHAGGVAQSGSGWYFKTGSYLQSNTDAGRRRRRRRQGRALRGRRHPFGLRRGCRDPCARPSCRSRAGARRLLRNRLRHRRSRARPAPTPPRPRAPSAQVPGQVLDLQQLVPHAARPASPAIPTP